MAPASTAASARASAPKPAFRTQVLSLSGEPISSPTAQSLQYTAAPTPAPAQTAIDTAMTAAPKLTGRAAPQPGMTDLTPQQTDYIIRTIAAESSGNPEESQGIANVIMNRINSGRFGPTPEHVLFSKNQFEPWSNKSLANYPLKIKPDSDRYQAAAGALDAALQGEDNTGGATYFWGPGSQYALGRNTPSWANKFPDYTDIGATRFHREGRANGGDVIAKALEALRSGTKVFPKPQRMFPEGARPPGGEYLNAATGETMTGQKPARAVIGVTPEGKPVFLADPEQVEATGSPGPGSTKTKTNLFKQQAGWKWNQAPEGYENVPTIMSAENRGQHYYGLGADFPKGVDLERYANATSEPRLRPTTQGNVYPGEQVGSIDVRGREHPVYDMLTIRNMLAGTGAGAAGAAAMPDDSAAATQDAGDGYAAGGHVDHALHMVRRHFDGSDGSFVDSNQAMRDAIANIDPERSQDQPVMDPATMGEAWDRARRNYQNFPIQEGEAVASQFNPSVRQEIGAAIAGEGGGRDYGSELRRRAGEALVGSSGLTSGMGALDFVPGASLALGATDIAHDLSEGDYANAGANVALPVAITAAQKFAGPIGKGLSYAGEKIARHATPIAAMAGTAAALTPDDAEAEKLSKLMKGTEMREHHASGDIVGSAIKKIISSSARSKAPIEKIPAVAERYPLTAPPVPAIDRLSGETYLAKDLSPEALAVQKARKAAQANINAGNYTPFFPPEQRFDANAANYPAYDPTTSILMKKPATQEKYNAAATAPEATERLNAAYQRGLQQKENAGNWYHMGQLEAEFIKEYGPELGPQMFKRRFADAMAATTGGADPTSNLMMAQYGNVLSNQGLPVPQNSYEFPFPVGGRYAQGNMDQYEKMIMQGAGVTPDNPKRYNFSNNFTGTSQGATIDEQMSQLFNPKMNMPPAGTYGHFEKALADQAAAAGVDPRYFQEVAWAGKKDADTKGGFTAQPMIGVVNEAIERTHQVTGMPREEIVRRGLVRGEIPLYGAAGATAAGAVAPELMGEQPEQPTDVDGLKRGGSIVDHALMLLSRRA